MDSSRQWIIARECKILPTKTFNQLYILLKHWTTIFYTKWFLNFCHFVIHLLWMAVFFTAKIQIYDFFTFSSWMRRYWFYVKNDFRNFHQIFTFWDPLSQKKWFLRKCLSVCLSACLSVVGRVRHNSRQNYQIELSFGTLHRCRKSKDKFVNQPHPIKIEGLSTTFVFLKITFWKNKKFQY